MLKEFLLQLSKDLNTETFLPREDGSYLLTFEPNMQISLRENANSGITLLTKIGALPPKSHEEFFLKLMKANLLGKETGNGILGLEKDAKEVSFTYFIFEGTAYKEAKEALEDFVNYAESWHKEILQFAEEVREAG